jgi:CelD/BcsL family acetyltransferase involved in cellulose biosynthesis
VFRQPDGARTLFPLGIGSSDYLDALMPPPHRPRLMALLFDALMQLRGEWDCCEWPQLRPGSPLLEIAAPPGWESAVQPGEPCPVLALPHGIPAVQAESLARRRVRASRKGELGWTTADADSLPALLQAHFDLHAASWQARDGGPGVLADPAVQAMHRQALPLLRAAGCLRLHALLLDGVPIATVQALVDPPDRADRRACFYLGGFDPRHLRLSPGMLAVGAAIESAAAEGFAAVDFLRGGEPHKYSWGAQDTSTFRRRLHAA